MPAERVDTVNAEDYFGKPISRYTRKQALKDGFQIDVSDTARQAGLRFPVFITRAVFETWVAPDHVKDENETARLRDILWMTRCAIKAAAPGACADPSATPLAQSARGLARGLRGPGHRRAAAGDHNHAPR